jgi:hypothetical protein
MSCISHAAEIIISPNLDVRKIGGSSVSLSVERALMKRYYFYSADLYYFDAAAGSAPSRIGDYQGVVDIDDDSLAPGQVFSSLLDELKKSIPADLGVNGYYHVTQFNNVT